jgi:hypothetical protein
LSAYKKTRLYWYEPASDIWNFWIA